MQPRETANQPPTLISDLRTLPLRPEVLREESPGSLAWWLPGEHGRRFRHWDRINVQPRSVFAPTPGVVAAPAGAIALRQAVGALHQVWRRIRGAASGESWVVPGGGVAEQCGGRRTELLVVGGADVAFDAARVRELWPNCGGVRQLGPAFFLVEGVQLETDVPAKSPPLPGSANERQLAERRLAAARSAADRHQEIVARIDLALLELYERRAGRAVELLEEARELGRNLVDRQLQCDVLVNLGFALIYAARPQQALPILEQGLALARAGDDRFTEKLALERLGLANVNLRESARALAYFEQALALAAETGDRKQQAELLWHLAILQFEAGRSDWGRAHARAAVDLLEEAQDPRASVFAEHLQRYSAGLSPTYGPAESIEHVTSRAPPWNETVVVQAGAVGPATESAGANSPGLLKMAFTAAVSTARHAGSGFRSVSEHDLRRRLETCAACEHHTGLRCRLCGCFTAIKARMPHERCPARKW